MFAFTNAKEKTSPTIIGAGCRVIGDIKTDHTVQIHGIVEGRVHSDIIVVGRGGKVVGEIKARELYLHGAVEGPATVETANILSDAVMTGTLSYIKLNITDNNGLECKLVKRKIRDS